PVRRKPAEGRAGARAGPRPEAPGGLAAHPWRRRRIDRVHPRAHHPGARLRRAGAAHLHQTRRGECPCRPHRRHVPRLDHRHRPRRHPSREAGPAHGGGEVMSEDLPAPTSRTHMLIRALAAGGLVRTLAALILAVVVGILLLIFTNETVLETLGYVFARPSDFFAAAGAAVRDAVDAFVRGAVWNTRGDTFMEGIRPLSETLRFAGPLIAAGLGIALGFRAGLFNIGGQGQ